MRQVGIVLTRQHRLLSVAAILDVFENVNKFYVRDGHDPFFDIRLIAAGDFSASEYSHYNPLSTEDAMKFDLVVVPAFMEEHIEEALESNPKATEWLIGQYRQGAEIASVCTGAFLLAATGLLNEKAATTHINSAAAFAQAFPQVRLKEHVIVTQDRGIYTSGGATSSFHLLLRLIENYCGWDMAVRTAKYFAIDMDREKQTYFGTFDPRETHHDELVGALQKRIRTGYSNASTIEELMNDIPSSRRNLVRRFKSVTGFTPIEYLQKTRIEAAKKILEASAGGVLESMIASGYSDEKAFRQLFKKNVGMTPSAYRNKYNRRSPEVYN